MADPKKIVMIDDEEFLCSLVKQKLEENGKYHVETVSDATQALGFIREQQPDLILLDIVMPGVSGTQIIDGLKSDGALKAVPVIVVSGKGEMVYDKRKHDFKWEPNSPIVKGRGELPEGKSAEALSQAYGVADYVAKPFTMELLESVVDEVMAKYAPSGDEDGGDI